METADKSEPEITILTKLVPEDRMAKLTELRNMGAAIHNDTLSEHERALNENGFQVKYRPKVVSNTYLNYVKCAGCFGYYGKHSSGSIKRPARCVTMTKIINY